MVSNSNPRKVNLAEPEPERRPHPMASELTDQEFRRTAQERRENHAAQATAGDMAQVSRPQRAAGRRLAAYGLLLLGLSIVIAMIVFGTWNWGLFALGLLILFCYMLIVTAPFWLASTTKAAQDEAAKDVVEREPHRAERAPERTARPHDSIGMTGEVRQSKRH